MALSVLLVPALTLAQSIGEPGRDSGGPNPLKNVYFGDAHVHTSMSLDAAAWGSTISPEDAYRYARGEEVTSFKGWKTQLTRPLDWLVIADHSDGYDLTMFVYSRSRHRAGRYTMPYVSLSPRTQKYQ